MFRVAVAGHDVGELGASVRGASEMRHRGHRRVPVDSCDELVRSLPRGTAGAVGDRDERRVERLELQERLFELRFGRGRLRWEELERRARTARKDVDDLGHTARRVAIGPRPTPARPGPRRVHVPYTPVTGEED